MSRRQRLAVLILWLLSTACLAAASIEIIALQHRSADELMPLLKPHLEANEGLSGTGYQLILRAAPQRQHELRALIAQLDQAAETVRISVRRAARETIARERAQAEVSLGAGGSEVEARGRAIVRSTRDKAEDNNNYQVTTLAGTPAYIHTGQAIPIATQTGSIVQGQVVVTQGIAYQQLQSGFYALARTRGDQVSVDISPQREVLDARHSGQINSSALQTRVQGRLGEWLELGGTAQRSTHQGGGLLRSTRSHADSEQSWWLKVERVD